MDWEQIQRALVVFAHPDDAEFGSAGTAAKMTRDGKKVFYAVATDGSKGSSDPAMTRERLITIRQQEQCEAARVLGVEGVDFLGFEDGLLEPTLDLRRAITASIRRYRPDVVICQNPTRDISMSVFPQHPDHLATGTATFAAVYPCARDRLTFPDLLDEGLEPHVVKEIWVAGTSHPDHFIDITETLGQKISALKAHASQIGDRPVEEGMRERARQMGEQGGFAFAEGFKRIEIP